MPARRSPPVPSALQSAVSVVLVAVAVSLAACGSDGGSAEPPDGEALYAQKCATCHGADLRGTPFGPSHLSEIYAPEHHPDETFRVAIRNGVQPHHWAGPAMPAVSGLDDAEIDAIIAFVREVQQREGFEPYPPG